MTHAGIPVPRSGQGDMPREKERHPASDADAGHPLKCTGQAGKAIIPVSSGGKPCRAMLSAVIDNARTGEPSIPARHGRRPA